MPSVISEPTRLTELVRAIALILATIGVVLTDEVQQAVVVVVGGLLVIGSWLLAEWNRRRVYAPDTVQAIANAATYEKPGTVVDIGVPPEGTVQA